MQHALPLASSASRHRRLRDRFGFPWACLLVFWVEPFFLDLDQLFARADVCILRDEPLERLSEAGGRWTIAQVAGTPVECRIRRF